MSRDVRLEPGPVTAERFVDWQQRLRASLGRTFDVVTPQAADTVTLQDLKALQISLYDALRVGNLVLCPDGKNRFQPSEFVADCSVQGLSKILWNLFESLRERNAWALNPRSITPDTVTSWIGVLSESLGHPTSQAVPSPIPKLAAVLEEALVWDGRLTRDVRKAYWDDAWHLAHDMWFGVESISREAFQTRFGVAPSSDKRRLKVATEVYLCKSTEDAKRAATSYAEKGRLPQPVVRRIR